jgi:EAL domain-containing protein (putative c-di-GMP-specific phosphodiesterase class I)/CheY-like chemotaxis protein
MRLLVVDDDDLLRDAVGTLLRDSHVEVDTASSAEEALGHLSAGPYDVVLSDIQMPGKSGVELLKAVRQFDLDVPVILMTGDPTVDSAVQALEYGAFRYLRKPVSAAELEETVTRAARYHALARLKRDAIGLMGGAAQWPADRAALEGRFEAAIDHLWMAFQPIVSCRQRQVHAYEALLRTDEPTLRNPQDFIAAAEQLGRLPDLGRAIRRKCGEALAVIDKDVRLFMNVHPADLNDPQLYVGQGPLAESSSRVIVEVTERASLHVVRGLKSRLDELRSMGFLLAVDDLGAGYAGLTSMAQLEPEYVKLDMSLIRGIDERPTQQKLVRSIVNVCQELDKKVIAEGVEEASECAALIEMGCDLLQGYLFARPQREPPSVAWD